VIDEASEGHHDGFRRGTTARALRPNSRISSSDSPAADHRLADELLGMSLRLRSTQPQATRTAHTPTRVQSLFERRRAKWRLDCRRFGDGVLTSLRSEHLITPENSRRRRAARGQLSTNLDHPLGSGQAVRRLTRDKVVFYAGCLAARSHSTRPAIGMWITRSGGRTLKRGSVPGRARHQALARLASKRLPSTTLSSAPDLLSGLSSSVRTGLASVP